MSELLQEATERFLDAMAPDGDDVIREMEAYGETHGPTTVGRPVGQLLRVMTGLSGAERVFETSVLPVGEGVALCWQSESLSE
jgi:predicted O-methyltransferase YrrM